MAGGFEALGLAPELVRAVTEDLGYLLPTNVQVLTPYITAAVNICALLGRDSRYPRSSLMRLTERDALSMALALVAPILLQQ